MLAKSHLTRVTDPVKFVNGMPRRVCVYECVAWRTGAHKERHHRKRPKHGRCRKRSLHEVENEKVKLNGGRREQLTLSIFWLCSLRCGEKY